MRTEKAIAVIFFIALVFKFMRWDGSNLILIIALSIIGMLYFPLAFYFFSGKSVKQQNFALSIVSGLFLSLIPVGIMFKLMYWQGGQLFLLIGLLTTPVLFAITYFLNLKAVKELKAYYKNMLLRTGVLTILTVFFYFISSATLLKIQYSDNPELARLKILHYNYPENQEYKNQLDEYLIKHNSFK